jgi:hypothetical protein
VAAALSDLRDAVEVLRTVVAAAREETTDPRVAFELVEEPLQALEARHARLVAELAREPAPAGSEPASIDRS